MGHTFRITPRPDAIGGGWDLKLLEDDEEAGGGVFPIDLSDPQKGIDWWNSVSETERTLWLAEAKSARPADAWRAWMTAEAHNDAHSEGLDWVNSHSSGDPVDLWPGGSI